MTQYVSIVEHDRAMAAPVERLDVPNGVLSEDAVARAFVDRHAGKLSYDHHQQCYFVFDGSRWVKDETRRGFHFARVIAREIASQEKSAVRAAAGKAAFAGGVERMAQSDPRIACTSDTWDPDPDLLGVPGGVVDLTTGAVRPARPDDRITKQAAVAPAYEASCPRWIRFLEEATGGDAEAIRFLKQWAGYCATGHTSEHALLFVFGPGKNGKSIFLNTLSGVLGTYATTSPMDTFTASKFDRHPTELAMLKGARLVTASETEEGRAWAEARVKAITGGDSITARFMRRDFFTFRPNFKLTIAGNHAPVLRQVDEAMRRRFRVVPFSRQPAEPDPFLFQKLQAEWPGILRWVIEGALDWRQNGLISPASVRAATDEYLSGQDTFAAWLDAECDVDQGNRHRWERTQDLFASWTNFARSIGEEPGSMKTFAPMLLARGFQKKSDGRARGFAGLNLRRPVAGLD